MLVLILSLFVLLAMGIPIAYALGLSAFAYFVVVQPDLMQILPQRLFSGMNNYALIALPLFILMGLVMNESGITGRLIRFCSLFVGKLRGGTGLVNVFASMIFGGISGSSASDTASIGSVLIPEMKSKGYPGRFAAGITVASSTMGMIIPPSVPIVLYAIVAQESVGRLFLGGIIPGLLIGFLQLFICLYISAKNKYPKEDIDTSVGNVIREIRGSFLVLLMPVLVVGAVVFGIATATESAGLGVLYALLLGYFSIGALTFKGLLSCFRTAIITSAKIMLIIAMSTMYIWILALERVPQAIAAWVTSMNLGPVSVMLLINVIILAIGTFIDVSPAIMLMTPVLLPAAMEAGVSPITFGVVLVSALAVGACTPPVGNCLNVCASVSGLRIGTIFRGALPFLLANFVVLLLITIFPQLVLWIPSVLMP